MSSISEHLKLIGTIASHFDHVMFSDEVVSYTVHDGNVRIASPDYTLIFEEWPTGPAQFFIADRMMDPGEALAYEVAEALALASHDLGGGILTALQRQPTTLTRVLIAELQSIEATF